MRHSDGLGNALQKKLKQRRLGRGVLHEKQPMFFQETEQNDADIKKAKMQSVLQQSSIVQFLQKAELSQQTFEADRLKKMREIREEGRSVVLPRSEHKQTKEEYLAELGLEMPLRPKWELHPNKEQLEQAQKEEYLRWRRRLAEVEQQEGVHVTPYQKNLEVWRQLWRVVDRSRLVVQILDARDPLFFRCSNFEQYTKSMGKQLLLLLNKSDLVSEESRLWWANHFAQLHVDCVFFSAKKELGQGQGISRVFGVQQLRLFFDHYACQNQGKIKDEEKQNTATEGGCSQNYEKNKEQEKEQNETHQQKAEVNKMKGGEGGEGRKGPINRQFEVGFVGYPNVGKSSVINALMGEKRVAVAAMPGKTKHFQTLVLSERVTLCDCPGLVFPKVAHSAAELIIHGLYPLDRLHDYEEAVQLVAIRVGQPLLCSYYGFQWNPLEPFNGLALLDRVALLRGMCIAKGMPHRAQVARLLLKDYVNGYFGGISLPSTVAAPPPSVQKQLLLQKRERQLDQAFFKRKDTVEQKHNLWEDISQQDLIAIAQGRPTVCPMNKNIRRQIKHGVKYQHLTLDGVRQMLKQNGKRGF